MIVKYFRYNLNVIYQGGTDSGLSLMVKEGTSVTAGESVMRVPMVSSKFVVAALSPSPLEYLICFGFSTCHCCKCFPSGGLHVNEDSLFFIVRYSYQGQGSGQNMYIIATGACFGLNVTQLYLTTAKGFG